MLRRLIHASQAHCWEALREEINKDPWGLAYRIVTRKTGALRGPAVLDADETELIVDALFPDHPLRPERQIVVDPENIPELKEEELAQAARMFKNRKAPGSDGIPAEVMKLAVQTCPRPLLKMYNACLRSGTWPARWKAQRLALLHKGKEGLSGPSAYRAICMMNVAGKLLEKMLRPRLNEAVRAAGDLSERQFGFRLGRSTMDAIRMVTDSWRVVLMATLDISNAFNSASSAESLEALEHNFRVAAYLLRMIDAYFRDRVIIYDTRQGRRRRRISAGVAQGSVFGPDIWDIYYDHFLWIEIPGVAFRVGFCDDAGLVIVARDLEDI